MEKGQKPSLEELRRMAEAVPPKTGGLTPSIAKAIPTPLTEQEAIATFSERTREIFPGGIESLSEITPENMEQVVAMEAENTFFEQAAIQEKKDKKIKTKRGRLRFIRNQFGYNRKYPKDFVLASKNYEEFDKTIAKFLGLTVNQVVREDLRSRKKSQKSKNIFEERFNGLFTIASIFEQNVGNDIFENRINLVRGNSRLTHISVRDAIIAGFPNIAVSLANDALRQQEETMGNQEDFDFNP